MESLAKTLALDELQNKAMDTWNGYAEKNFQTKDPYRYETPDGKTKKLKLDESASKEDQKMWKWVQKRAWLDDKCFMGCYPIDCGIGLGPLAVMLPVIGPFLMYGVHAKLTTKAGQYWHLDAKTVAKMQANILFDFLISLPPLLGSLFVWMNGCSTRNAAIIHTEVTKALRKKQAEIETQNQKSSRGRDAQLGRDQRAQNQSDPQWTRQQVTRQQQQQQQQQQQHSNPKNVRQQPLYQQQPPPKDYQQTSRPESVQHSNSYKVPPANYQPKYGQYNKPQPAIDPQTPHKTAIRGPSIPHLPFDDPPAVPPRN